MPPGRRFAVVTCMDARLERESVRRVGDSPFLPGSFGATGFVYDVRSGRLREVA